MREFPQDRDGFISIERFQSLHDERKILSLSFWRDEDTVSQWRNLLEHRAAQEKGRRSLFDCYRIRVADVVRDYSGADRRQTPTDSKAARG